VVKVRVKVKVKFKIQFYYLCLCQLVCHSSLQNKIHDNKCQPVEKIYDKMGDAFFAIIDMFKSWDLIQHGCLDVFCGNNANGRVWHRLVVTEWIMCDGALCDDRVQ
jgi:hypothetical protein